MTEKMHDDSAGTVRCSLSAGIGGEVSALRRDDHHAEGCPAASRPGEFHLDTTAPRARRGMPELSGRPSRRAHEPLGIDLEAVGLHRADDRVTGRWRRTHYNGRRPSPAQRRSAPASIDPQRVRRCTADREAMGQSEQRCCVAHQRRRVHEIVLRLGDYTTLDGTKRRSLRLYGAPTSTAGVCSA